MSKEYGCGHSPTAEIFNTSTIAISAYFTWKGQVEDGNMSECFNCFCKRIRKKEGSLK